MEDTRFQPIAAGEVCVILFIIFDTVAQDVPGIGIELWHHFATLV